MDVDSADTEDELYQKFLVFASFLSDSACLIS